MKNEFFVAEGSRDKVLELLFNTFMITIFAMISLLLTSLVL